MHKNRNYFFSIVIAVWAFCWVTSYSPAHAADEAAALTSPLIPLSGPSAELTLGQFKGKVVLVDFWATWCIPCLRSFPFYQSLQDKYGSDGFVVVAVNNEDNTEKVKKFYADRGVTYLVVKDKDNQLSHILQPGKMPTCFIFDKQGKLVSMHEGFEGGDEEVITEMVEKVLGKK